MERIRNIAIVVSFLLVLCISAFEPAYSASPIPPAIRDEFAKVNLMKTVKVTFDIAAIQSEASSSSGVGLKAYLPINSIITEVYMYIVTQFVDDASRTFALECEDATNIMQAADITEFVAGTFVTVIDGDPLVTSTGQTLSSSSAQAIGDACEINGVYSGAASAGKLIAIIKYFIF